MENANKDTLRRLEVMTKLRTAEELYTLVSLVTREPFVQCDPETYDDVVYVYEKEEDVKREGMRFIELKHPLRIQKLTQQELLVFYTNLYTIGANCIVFNGFMEDEYKLQVTDLVKKPANTPDGKVWIQNSELHLTALYFMQELRRQNLKELTPELKEMQNEIIANYAKGTFLVLTDENNRLPILKHPNGDIYLPIFTDLKEAGKLNSEQPVKIGAIPAAKIAPILPPEAKGIVINPGGVSLQLPITRKPAPTQTPDKTE